MPFWTANLPEKRSHTGHSLQMSPSINLVHLNSLVFTQNSIRIFYRIPPVGSFDVYKQVKQNFTTLLLLCMSVKLLSTNWSDTMNCYMCIVLDQFVHNKTNRILTHEQSPPSGYWSRNMLLVVAYLRFKTIMILLNEVKI